MIRIQSKQVVFRGFQCNSKKEIKPLLIITGTFLLLYYLPVGRLRFDGALLEAFHLAKWYAREHVVLCLLPAFFIAGAISVFVSQASVLRYFGPEANKVLSYGVASVSGTILAVCSCTVLPLFTGIYRMGAGLGPASAFLYSGPAINVLAIILTARILGLDLGIARAVGAIVFSVLIGLLMHLFFRGEEQEKIKTRMAMPEPEEGRPLIQTALYFAAMVCVLVFANWAKPEYEQGFWYLVYSLKWLITGVSALALGFMLIRWFGMAWWKVAAVVGAVIAATLVFSTVPMIPFAVGVFGLSTITATSSGETEEWFSSSWGYAKQIMPLLFFGVLIAGFLLGRPDHEGMIPSTWVARAVGGNSFAANFAASLAGAFMYFATLTEVPILQGLIGSGMGKGPALALLLAGPALSLPSMLVIHSVMGTKKTVVFVALVVVLSTAAGMLFGMFFE